MKLKKEPKVKIFVKPVDENVLLLIENANDAARLDLEMLIENVNDAARLDLEMSIDDARKVADALYRVVDHIEAEKEKEK